MKMITAYIKPERLEEVKKELFTSNVFRMSVTNAIGCGSQMGYTESYRGAITEINLLKKIRLDIAVNEDFVEKTIAAIIKGARTNTIGDGKIFVTDILECIRIRTGEQGDAAIG